MPPITGGPVERLHLQASVVLLLASCSLCPCPSSAARILVHPMPWASHTLGMAKLAAELSRRGHEVCTGITMARCSGVTVQYCHGSGGNATDPSVIGLTGPSSGSVKGASPGSVSRLSVNKEESVKSWLVLQVTFITVEAYAGKVAAITDRYASLHSPDGGPNHKATLRVCCAAALA